MAVYELKFKDNLVYKKSKSNSVSYLEKDVVEKIIELWMGYKNGKVFNSTNIRLDNICVDEQRVILSIGYTYFYDFLVSNIIRQQFETFKCYIEDSEINEGKELIKALENYYASIKDEYDSIQSLIKDGNMANAIAISVLVMDKNDNVMLVKRSNKVAIGKDLYSVTATGATDEKDYEDENPIKHCALRELSEELKFKIDINDLYVKAIVAGKKKMQPIAIVDAIVPFNLGDVKIEKDDAEDFEFEVDKVFICKREDIRKILEQQTFTEAGEYHLKSVLNLHD